MQLWASQNSQKLIPKHDKEIKLKYLLLLKLGKMPLLEAKRSAMVEI
jgi:hypothetical protein